MIPNSIYELPRVDRAGTLAERDASRMLMGSRAALARPPLFRCPELRAGDHLVVKTREFSGAVVGRREPRAAGRMFCSRSARPVWDASPVPRAGSRRPQLSFGGGLRRRVIDEGERGNEPSGSRRGRLRCVSSGRPGAAPPTSTRGRRARAGASQQRERPRTLQRLRRTPRGHRRPTAGSFTPRVSTIARARHSVTEITLQSATARRPRPRDDPHAHAVDAEHTRSRRRCRDVTKRAHRRALVAVAPNRPRVESATTTRDAPARRTHRPHITPATIPNRQRARHHVHIRARPSVSRSFAGRKLVSKLRHAVAAAIASKLRRLHLII